MRTRRGRCSIFAVHPASGQQPRLARAARRAQGPRSGHFGKLDPLSFYLAINKEFINNYEEQEAAVPIGAKRGTAW